MSNRIVIRQRGASPSKHLREMAERARDVAPAFRAWGDDVRSAFREQFDSEGVRLGGRVWPPLSPKYAAWKAAHYPGRTILRRTDRMHGELTGHPMNIERVTRNSGEFGARDKILGFHQRGTHNRDGSVRMPQRKVVILTDDLRAKATSRIRDHIVGRS